MGGKISNGCLSWFMIGTSRYDFPRTNQGPTRRTLQFEAALLSSVHWRDTRRGVMGSTGHWGYLRTALRKIVSPCLPSYYYTRWKGMKGVMGSIGCRGHRHPILRKIEGSLAYKVSNRDDGSAGRGGCPSICRRTVNGVSSVRVEFSLMDFNGFI